jgi:hypothetical protein
VIIIYGTKTYGTIDTDEGAQLATRFIHIYYLPLIPIGGAQLLGDDKYLPVPMNGKSVLLAYARVWGFFALGALVVNTYLALERGFVGGAIMGALTLAGIGVWAALMLKAGVKRAFSPVGYALVLGIPLLALGIATFTGVNERIRRMKWEKEDALADSKALLMDLAKKEVERQDNAKLNDELAERERKCDEGSGLDCNELGFALSKTDPKRSLEAYTRGCDADFGMACFNEGLVLSKTNATEAAMLYERSCELDYANGCNNLATGLEKKDARKAVQLFQKGCDLKSGLACRNLARMTELGDGTRKNVKLARTLYKQGCELGDSVACGKK